VARLARGDVNMPKFCGFPIQPQVPEVKFEATNYALLHGRPDILASCLPYHRIPVQHGGPILGILRDITGHRLIFYY